MELDNKNESQNSSLSEECVVLSLSPVNSTETPKRSTSKIRISKVESVSEMYKF
jgi:SepF-like predicted cell division protein (DUF552 family)